MIKALVRFARSISSHDHSSQLSLLDDRAGRAQIDFVTEEKDLIMHSISSIVLATSLMVAAVPAFAFTATAPAAVRSPEAMSQVTTAHYRARRHHCNGTHNGNCRLYRKNF